VEMVAPARTYYVPVARRCNTCGYQTRHRPAAIAWAAALVDGVPKQSGLILLSSLV